MGQQRERATSGQTTGSSPALYATICDELIAEIRAGTRPPGTWMPTNSDIQDRWGVSNRTSRRVLYELEQAGLIKGQGTRGYLVTGQRQIVDRTIPDPGPAAGHHPTYAAPRPAHTVSLGGNIPDQLCALQVIRAGWEPAPPDVAQALRLPGPGAPVCVRHRLVTDPPGAVTLELRTSYTPHVPSGSPLTEHAIIPGSWPEILTRYTNHRPVTATTLVSVRQPSGHEAPALQITPQASVLVRTSTLHSSDGTPVDQTISIWPADSTTIHAVNHPLN
ncbi:GntR family transcriptional regulator [Spirillospora sp. NBC_01491]|uniref:GntR family transcriptional regulator n=1 Tax=Spirillospora sp. NBC_01491 TaxID=2976007 RepID=UPI002E366AE8|nr:GntR family transcriptional regulator [Spirillospora sp. NBC_01491]